MTKLDWLRHLARPPYTTEEAKRTICSEPWNVYDGADYWTVSSNAKAMVWLPGNIGDLNTPGEPTAERLLRFLQPQGRPLEPIGLRELREWCGPPWRDCPDCGGSGSHQYVGCRFCGGNGIIPTTEPCPECKGVGGCGFCDGELTIRPTLYGWLCRVPIDRLLLAEFLAGVEGDPLLYGTPGEVGRQLKRGKWTEPKPLWLVADSWRVVICPIKVAGGVLGEQAKWDAAPRLGDAD